MKKTILSFLLGSSAMFFSAQGANLPTPLALPQRIYVLEGMPGLIRFENLVYTPVKGSILFDAEGEGAQYNDRLVWRPKNKDVAPFQVSAFSGENFEKLDEASAEWIYCNPSAVASRGTLRWLAIGASLTLPGHYLTQTVEMVAEKVPGISLVTVGTQHPKDDTSISHEGRGGWSWRRYLEAFPPKSQFQSPFVFGPRGEEDFDFARYLRDTLQAGAPDLVTILLGPNDVYGISADFHPDKVDAIVDGAVRMVAKIRAAAPDAVIGIIPPPPSSEQNGFGANYRNGVTEWQYRRALQFYHAALLRAFDGRWNEKIYIVPGYLAFDPSSSYPGQPGPSKNALHPEAKGFEPISLSLSAWLIHLLSTNSISPK